MKAAAPQSMQLEVHDLTGQAGPRPVTGGVPLPEGAAPSGAAFSLAAERGAPIPVQTRPLATWPDGSVRWVLLDFAADPPPSGASRFVLSWSRGGAPGPPPAGAARARSGARAGIASDLVRIERTGSGLFRLNDAYEVSLQLVNGRGRKFAGVVDTARVETAGPLRSTLAVRGGFQDRQGARSFDLTLRVSVYAGLSLVRVEPMIVVSAEAGALQSVRELNLDIRRVGRPDEPTTVSIGGEPGWRGALTGRETVRLFQVDDERYRIEGAAAEGGKAPGWCELTGGDGVLAVCLRDFWQQWPKSIEACGDGVRLGLFPRFAKGAFAHMQPWHKYQYPFKGACFQLKTGQAKRWDVWLDAAGNGERLARIASAPLAPSADPASALGAGVWGPIEPAGAPGLAAYDAWAEQQFQGYLDAIAAQRDYGAMNWGDWWGERGCNWGNHEYDTGNLILIQYARTGDPRYLHAAEAGIRHVTEVDVIHSVNPDLEASFHPNPKFPVRPGCVHEHCIGHVGGFCSTERVRRIFVKLGVGKGAKRPHLCLEPRNLGHVWTQGMARLHFLTGDPWLRETAELVADNLARLVETRGYPFMGHSHCGRTAGWTIQALAASYELGRRERYRRAMKRIVNDALAEQDPNCGGWLYELPRGHCFCETRKHVGMAGFITCVLANGLARHYDMTGDPRVPEAIRRAVTFVNLDTWQDQDSDWRYTSCPVSPLVSQIGVTIQALANSVRITGDAEHLRILGKAWAAKFERLLKAQAPGPGFGKDYSLVVFGAAEAASVCARRPS